MTVLAPDTGAASSLPDAPARDSHCLDNADHQLGHEGEEEGHEAERAVCPAREGSVTPYTSTPAALQGKGDAPTSRTQSGQKRLWFSEKVVRSGAACRQRAPEKNAGKGETARG